MQPCHARACTHSDTWAAHACMRNLKMQPCHARPTRARRPRASPMSMPAHAHSRAAHDSPMRSCGVMHGSPMQNCRATHAPSQPV
eukprot:358519-Chlamydomonas_euryale.AAC.6